MQWHSISIEDTVDKLNTDIDIGLSSKAVKERLEKYGENKLKEKKPKNLSQKFLTQFSDFMVLILFAAAIISFTVSLIGGKSDYIDPIIILLIVIINAIIGVIQESKAERAIEALKKMAAPSAMVKRNGRIKAVKSNELVVGDIVILETGDIVPADIRVIKTNELYCEESALTGESLSVEKNGVGILPKDTLLGDRKNMLYMGSSISAGHGEGIVVETGMNTQMGTIAQMIDTQDTTTPLQKKLAKIGKLLGICALIICAVIFVVGILRKKDILEMFVMSVSLAVAAIPEGLPSIVTIVLSIGVKRMAEKNTIVRKLPAVETLGGVDIICCDKTGTLTQNKMQVKKVFDMLDDDDEESKQRILRFATLCNNSIMTGDRILGEPTEAAIVVACKSDINELNEKYQRVKEISFTSKRKMMTTVHKNENKYLVITKGAPEVLMSRCSKYSAGGILMNFDISSKNTVSRKCSDMASDALRVLAVAYKETEGIEAASEENLIFLGLIALADPIKPKVKDAVGICRNAGIIPVMITGDHRITAKAVAEEIGISESEGQIITGAEIDKMDDEKFKDRIDKYRVFARVSPQHKVRIVKALQSKGNVVAMTGDGINDAPALGSADIGCAMGKSGTEVAKSASDIIIADDDFSTIVAAVKEGRGIYLNIMRTIHFLVSCNIGEILTVFFSIIMNFPYPLEAIQLLWVNLITDSLPALALGEEPIRDDVMETKKTQTKGKFISGMMMYDIVVEGCLIGALSSLAYTIGRAYFDADINFPVIGRTMAFATLSLSQIAHSFNMRSGKSIFQSGFFSGSKLFLCAVICAFMQIVVIEVPKLSVIFKTHSLPPVAWIIVLILSLTPIFLIEIEKKLKNVSKLLKKH